MIKSTNLRTLWNLEFFQTMTNMLTYLKDEKLDELRLTDLVLEFEERLNVLDQKLVLARGNVLSEKLLKADSFRDTVFRGFYNSVKIYVNYPEAAKSEAAKFLLRVIDKYGKDIDRMTYVQESGALTNIFQELSGEENVARIALLGLTDWYTQLETAQHEFNTLFMSREVENAEILSGEVVASRQALQDTFTRMGKMINAYELVYGEEAYVTLCKKINEAVSYACQQASRRGPREKPASSPVTE